MMVTMVKGNLIYFMGIDGSGKSTLSNYLKDELKLEGYDVDYLWWFDGENSLIRRIIKKISSVAYEDPKDAVKSNSINSRNNLVKTLYSTVVIFDYLKSVPFKLYMPLLHKNKILILDRSMYDTILSLSNEFNFSKEKKDMLLRFYNKISPEPKIIFYIHVDYEIAFSRKKEDYKTLENAKSLSDNYQKLTDVLGEIKPGKLIKIDNSKDLEYSKNKIKEHLKEL